MAYWETSAEIAGPDDTLDPAQSLDRWKRAAYDREKLPRKEVAAVIDRAKAANWAGGKAGDVARSHFDKHRHLLGIADQSAYNQGAIDNIRRAGSDVYLSVRDGSLRASFVRPATRIDSKGGKRKGVAVSIVDIEANRLVSYHFKEKMTSTVDEVPPMKQGGWGIVKWLIG